MFWETWKGDQVDNKSSSALGQLISKSMWWSATVKLWLCTTYILTTKLWLSYENWHALFWWQVIEAQVDMPVVGAITLYVSLLTFTLRVHPDRLDYVDQVLVCYSSFDKIVQLECRILVPKLLFVFRQLAAVKCSYIFLFLLLFHSFCYYSKHTSWWKKSEGEGVYMK